MTQPSEGTAADHVTGEARGPQPALEMAAALKTATALGTAAAP
jgi:hypothetical protein